MQTYGMALDLRDDPQLIARYKKEHAEVWPEVVARLHEIGVTEMKIFLLGRRMFMYCETRDGFDPAMTSRARTTTPRTRSGTSSCARCRSGSTKRGRASGGRAWSSSST